MFARARLEAHEEAMNHKLMILPACDSTRIRLVSIPEDIEEHEVFRHVTGLVASVEEDNPAYTWDDIAALLEDHGFEPVDFVLGPALD
jgi:hypothetical protein